MSSSDPAFGRMLRQLVDLGVLKLEMEPLDDRIERRLKQFWESRTVHGVAILPSVRGNQRIVSTAVAASLSPSTPTECCFTRNTSPQERCFSRSCSTQIP